MPDDEKAPLCPADPRPDNKPYYIDQNCPDCGTPLVLSDLFDKPDTPEDEIWYDEFVCPKCQDGIFLDISEEEAKEIFDYDYNESECISLDELRKELDLLDKEEDLEESHDDVDEIKIAPLKKNLNWQRRAIKRD